MAVPTGSFISVLQMSLLEGARALGLKLIELLVAVGAMAVVLAAVLYLLVSLRLAAVMERVRNL